MLDMVQQVLYFCTTEVIELESRKFSSQMERSVTVDQLMRDHIDFFGYLFEGMYAYDRQAT